VGNCFSCKEKQTLRIMQLLKKNREYGNCYNFVNTIFRVTHSRTISYLIIAYLNVTP
jgi:hypothetical protein